LVPTRVRLIHRRENGCAELAAFFGIDVEFGASVDAVAFTTTVKDRPIVSADPYLNKFLGLQEIEWVILGIIAADKLVDRGFL
jgi:hypothetical protein